MTLDESAAAAELLQDFDAVGASALIGYLAIADGVDFSRDDTMKAPIPYMLVREACLYAGHLGV
jgi:hypothetical protein